LAKNLYNVHYKSNFSFKKIKDNIDKILNESVVDISTEFAKKSKENIDKGLNPELKASTLNARDLGLSSFSGHNPKPSPNNDIPLRYTDRLYDSIKGTKKGVEAVSYALEHEKGFQGTTGRVPARPFLAKSIDKKNYEKLGEAIMTKITKGMKK
jgi:hypothetical protein